MTFEEAQAKFLQNHVPGKMDIYMFRPGVDVQRVGLHPYCPDDFEIKKFNGGGICLDKDTQDIMTQQE